MYMQYYSLCIIQKLIIYIFIDIISVLCTYFKQIGTKKISLNFLNIFRVINKNTSKTSENIF